jgi:neurofibromin 1
MAFWFKIYGTSYLHNLLQPLLTPLMGNPSMGFEVDPARLDTKDDIDENLNNLVTLTECVFRAIVSSADKFPTQKAYHWRIMCPCLQVLSKRYPQFPQNNIGAVGL